MSQPDQIGYHDDWDFALGLGLPVPSCIPKIGLWYSEFRLRDQNLGIENLGLGLDIGIGDWDYQLLSEIWIGYWDWGSILQNTIGGLWLGIRIGVRDWDWGLRFKIGYWD